MSLDQADEKRILGQRLRRRRLEAGLTQTSAAQNAGETVQAWKLWELGTRLYPVRVIPAIAAALGVPIASLLTDQVVLQEIRVSEETLERIRREGKPAAEEVAQRLAANALALLMAEASRPPVDLSPHARAKPRRTREQLLAFRTSGIAEAERRRAEKEAERRRARRVAQADELSQTG